MLGRRENGSQNLYADLFTKDLGRIEARVISGRKITSKLSPHLDLGTRVFIRVVYKNQFTLADSLLEERFFTGLLEENDDFFSILRFCRDLVPHQVPDPDLWEFLCSHLREARRDSTMLLNILGYGREDSEKKAFSVFS